MINNPVIFLVGGIVGTVVSLYSFAKYYSLSGVGALDAKTAANYIKDDKIKYVIDVRTKMEWDYGHYKDAIHVPVTEFREDHPKFRNINKSAGILVYCNTGQRARYAAEKLRSYGYRNVYYLTGSYK